MINDNINNYLFDIIMKKEANKNNTRRKNKKKLIEREFLFYLR